MNKTLKIFNKYVELYDTPNAFIYRYSQRKYGYIVEESKLLKAFNLEDKADELVVNVFKNTLMEAVEYCELILQLYEE